MYKEKLKNAYEILRQDVLELGSSSSENWIVQKKESNIVVKKLKKQGISSSCFKTVGEVNATPKAVLENVLLDNSRRKVRFQSHPSNLCKDWNPTFAEQTIFETYEEDNHHYRIYQDCQQAALGGLISAREFVECGDWFEDDEGRIWFVYVSYEYDKCPPSQKYVRGTVYPSGYMIEQSKSNPSHATVSINEKNILRIFLN